jgi:hypothetical protein
MTRLKLAAAGLAVMTAAATTVAAGAEIRVDHWVTLCSSRTESDQTICRSYARGVADTLIYMRKINPQQVNICIPDGVADKDLVDLTLPFVQGQPPTSPPLPASNLLVSAFAAGFPCKRPSR